ncbi:hypothetical protein ACQUJT_24405 [Ralstonia pseudosolanacearum]
MTIVAIFWAVFTATVHGWPMMLGAALGFALAVGFIGLLLAGMIAGVFSQVEAGF